MRQLLCKEILATAVAAVLVLCGCEDSGGSLGKAITLIDHSSDRLLLMSVHDAVMKKDYGSLAGAMEKDYRGPYESMLKAVKQYIEAREALADEVDQKIDPQRSKRYREVTASIYADLIPSPLEGAANGDKFDWDKVKVLDEGDAYAVMVTGRETAFDRDYRIREVKGKWFVVPNLKDVPPNKKKVSYKTRAEETTKEFKEFTKEAQQFKSDVRSGKVNKNNFDETVKALQPAPSPSKAP